MRREKRIEVLCKKKLCYFFWDDDVYEVPASRCKEVVSLIRKEIDKYNRYMRNIIEEAASLGAIIVIIDVAGRNLYEEECEQKIKEILNRYSVRRNKTLDRYYK